MQDGAGMSFWDHLDVLRGALIRMIVSVVLLSVVVFCFKSFVFDYLVLAPASGDFFVYKLLGVDFRMDLINIEISAQFFTHLKVSVILGIVLAFPYIIYEIWRFIAPALYANEIKAVRKAFGFASLLFYLGVAIGYLIVLPITLNFFQSYTVSDSVVNTITLQSYISMLTSMVLLFGLVFEFPTVLAVLSKMGIVHREMLRKYRKHAIVAILIVAAIITPADPFSMIIAALPLYLLYELSVLVCAKKKEAAE
ncbi:MAG: twin-arginine translocase subunit TatC [Bacteroidales bacterium]|nr:twin-arginine translocase subunit TatC [Bacteroidales bacterium]